MGKPFFLHEIYKLLHQVLTQTDTAIFGKENKITQLYLLSPMLGYQAADHSAFVFTDPDLIFLNIILPPKIFQSIQYIRLKVEAIATFLCIQVAMQVSDIA